MKRRKDYKPKPTRCCERCGTVLVPRIFSGGEEELSAYMKRKYCSRTCSSSRGKKGLSRTQRMVQARQIALKETCGCCGGKDRLAIHHVNEDWTDGRLENLQTLCAHCHQQWHGLHRKLGIKTFMPMPPLASLSVSFYTRIRWGNYDPRREQQDSGPTATRSTSKRRPSSSAPAIDAPDSKR